METLTISSLRNQRYIAHNTDQLEEYKSDYFAFNIFGVTYWAGVHTTTVDPESQIFVMYEGWDYNFKNLEDAICFSLGGSMVQQAADDYDQDDNVDNEEKYVKLAYEIIDTLEYNLQINDKQADKLKEGAEEYARVWL